MYNSIIEFIEKDTTKIEKSTKYKLKCLIPPSPYAVEFSYAQVAFNLSHYCVMLIVVL